MSDCLQMPWSIEDTINHLECIRNSLARQLGRVNFEGKAEQDITELNYDFDRAIEALKENQQYRQIGTLEHVREFDALYLEKCHEVNELRKQMRWIPVEERLPTKEEFLKNNGRFILDDGNRRYQGLFDIYDGKFKFSKHINGISFGLFEDERVVAWKPLPEPYNPENPQESPCNATGWQQRMLNVFLGGKTK